MKNAFIPEEHIIRICHAWLWLKDFSFYSRQFISEKIWKYICELTVPIMVIVVFPGRRDVKRSVENHVFFQG